VLLLSAAGSTATTGSPTVILINWPSKPSVVETGRLQETIAKITKVLDSAQIKTRSRRSISRARSVSDATELTNVLSRPWASREPTLRSCFGLPSVHCSRWLGREWPPGSIRYSLADLSAFADAAGVLLYVGPFTAVNRLSLLLRAYARVRARFGPVAPLIIWGGHPGEWEGEPPYQW
jgi:hypothetical protein